MIRASLPFDVVRYGVLGGPAPGNRASPLASVGFPAGGAMSKRDVIGAAISIRRKGSCSVTQSHGRYVPMIVIARPRSSQWCWDVTHLFSDSPHGASSADVLDVLLEEVSRRGGERIFVRLWVDDPLIEIAASRGFTNYGEETLLAGPADALDSEMSLGVGPMRGVDQHGLFRLYNASTPARVRMALGMTFDQWLAAREDAGWRSREYVHRTDEAVRAWVQVTRRGRSAVVTCMTHPGYDERALALMRHGVSRAWGVNAVLCLVRDSQVRLQSLMRERGFREVGRYATMMRSITIPMKIVQSAPAVRLTRLEPMVDLTEHWQSFRRKPPVDLHSR